MQVIITAVASAGNPLPKNFTFKLSAGGLESPDDFTINSTRKWQPVEGLRADSVNMIDRKNRKTTLSFKVRRLFTTIDKAEQYILLHEANMPSAGTVKFITEGGFAFYMRNAAVEVNERKHIGKTTFHSYQLTGGAITTI